MVHTDNIQRIYVAFSTLEQMRIGPYDFLANYFAFVSFRQNRTGFAEIT